MVSFLGLRFGSDRKKLQSKQQEAERSAQKWKKGAQRSVDSDQSFGHTATFPRSQRPPSRPGTSYSTVNLRAPFANPEATSSMVDLAPLSPRRPSATSLRQAASSSNLKGGRGGRPAISGPIGPPLPLPLGSDLSQPGTPTRPGTAGSMKKDWVNPFEAQRGKDMASNRPHTSAGSSGGRSPFNKSDFDIGDPGGNGRSVDAKVDSSVGPDGYPSPPPSVKSVEQGLTRVNTEPRPSQGSNKPSAPSTLRRVNTAEQTSMPSPAVSEERLDAPVVRNVFAKRDTMTFHSPRRKSFAKQIDEDSPRRQTREKTEHEKAEIKRRRQTEGFEGNFAAFNFGPSTTDTSVPLPTETSVSPTSTTDRAESPNDSKVATPPEGDRRCARERGMSVAMTNETIDREQKADEDTASVDCVPQPPAQDSRPTGTPPAAAGAPRANSTPSLESLPKSLRARVDSDTRSPGTPTALRAPPPAMDRVIRSVSPPRDQSHEDLEDAPPPALNPDRRSQSPLRSKLPIEGDFPVSKGLPRGRRPGSPGSQRGRSPVRFEEAAPPTLNPDRRSQSPLRSKQPIEGGFPVSKGLPRGRRPGPGPEPIVPVPYGNGTPPPRPPRESEGITTLPGWAGRGDKHLSAVPPPLSPLSKSSFADGATTALAPPRLPSPAFTSLEESISSSTGDLAAALGLESSSATSASQDTDKPLISPVLSEFGARHGDGRSSPKRVEAKKAPPRPPPITLPPSNGTTPNGSVKSPAAGEFSPGFI